MQGWRDEAANTVFFRQTIANNGIPDKVGIDNSGANSTWLENILTADVCR